MDADYWALIYCFIIILAFLRFTEFLADSKTLSSSSCRKVVHVLTGIIYLLCWPLYSDADSARYICSIVPIVVTLRFALIGLGKDPTPPI